MPLFASDIYSVDLWSEELQRHNINSECVKVLGPLVRYPGFC